GHRLGRGLRRRVGIHHRPRIGILAWGGFRLGRRRRLLLHPSRAAVAAGDGHRNCGQGRERGELEGRTHWLLLGWGEPIAAWMPCVRLCSYIWLRRKCRIKGDNSSQVGGCEEGSFVPSRLRLEDTSATRRASGVG